MQVTNPSFPWKIKIFLGALKSGVLESNDFPQKFLNCFWWGLQNMRYWIYNCQN